jgi:hypothetical protein
MSVDNTAQSQLGKLKLSQPELKAIQSMMKQFEQARRKRVNRLMNAIAELQTGDLEAVIDLDTVAPMEEDGPSRLDPNEARNGRELAEILEDRLIKLLVITHPYPSDQAAVRWGAGAARASRMAASALRPARRPVATTEQRSA